MCCVVCVRTRLYRKVFVLTPCALSRARSMNESCDISLAPLRSPALSCALLRARERHTCIFTHAFSDIFCLKMQKMSENACEKMSENACLSENACVCAGVYTSKSSFSTFLLLPLKTT